MSLKKRKERTMIAELTFIDELKGIKKSLGVGTDNATFKLIDTIQRKWEKQVDDFEKAVAPTDPVEWTEVMGITGLEQNENK
jgi:hypothetical protein|tara:strand:- start:204 stop:449 length:246 start_codon:yes stop_codon:yes gene_type:complete